VIVYSKTYKNLLLENTSPSVLRVFGLLMTMQEFDNGIKITKKAIADILKISYDSVMVALKWLKENGYVKEHKVNGITEFLLNPKVTTCGKNRKAKLALWESIK
jgi:DNA-binding transcriptional ArsR family regulator